MASRRKKAKHTAAKPRPTPSALKLALQERDEALRFQAATAEILASLSRSSADARPVFEAIVANVLKLFRTRYAAVFVVKGEELHLAASQGDAKLEKRRAPAFEKFRASFPQRIDWKGFTGRALRSGKVSQIAPIIGNPKATAQAVNLAKDFGYDAMLVAPLMRDGKAIGAIGTTRPEGKPFDARQLALFEAFAAQAVIAIENARLFNETRESLEQQTALGEVLRIVSRTVTDAQPAIDAILDVVLRLFPTFDATVWLARDKHLVPVARGGPTVGRTPGQRVPVTRDYFHGCVILDRKAYRIDNVAVSKELSEVSRADLLSRERRAILMVPLVRQGEAIGAISVSRAEPFPFSPRQVALLGNFADQAVIAIENARLFNETEEALERQTATSEILKVIAASPADVKPVFDAILRSAVTLCGAELAAVFPFDGKLVHMTATHNWPQPALEYFSKVYPSPPDPHLLSGRTILSRAVVQIPDAAADEHYDPGSVATGHWRRMIGVPMLREGRPLGAMVVAWRDPGEAPPGQVDLLQTFADQAAIAVENVRLFNETKEALEQQTATADILRVISGSPTNVQPVFEAILDKAIRLCDAHLGGLFLQEPDGAWTMVSYKGDDPGVQEAFRRVEAGPHTGFAKLAQLRRPVHIPDLHVDSDTAKGDRLRVLTIEKLKARTFFAVPLLKEGEVVGAAVIYRREVRPFSEAQIRLVTTFADQAVIAIENVRLFNETKEALEQQKASADVLGAISGSIADTKPVFEKILASCERLFEGELVGITLADGDTVRLAAYHGPRGEQLEKVYPLPLTRQSGTGWAILNAQIAHFPDIEAEGVPPGVVAGCRTLKVRAIVFAPMLFEGKGIGAIWVARGQPGAFTDKQIAHLRTFADQAVIAIQNARLFREIQEKSAQLEVANKHKSDFLANMSHELRTPLNAIIGFSEVLSERMFGEVNEKQAEYLKDIHESGRHLLSLINDILDLSKIEAGRMELELSTFDLPAAVSNAMTLVRERAQRHGIRLGIDMDPRLGAFQADERKVKQILLNLLSNAVKFTPDGGQVDVSAKLDTDKVEIAVKDTGIGIAPEDHAAVFEEFKQVGRDYTRKAEGTGLGLALTKRLVELHGGEIALESAPGQGSTFTVKLPLR